MKWPWGKECRDVAEPQPEPIVTTCSPVDRPLTGIERHEQEEAMRKQKEARRAIDQHFAKRRALEDKLAELQAQLHRMDGFIGTTSLNRTQALWPRWDENQIIGVDEQP